jgi:hypothetical protein
MDGGCHARAMLHTGMYIRDTKFSMLAGADASRLYCKLDWDKTAASVPRGC